MIPIGGPIPILIFAVGFVLAAVMTTALLIGACTCLAYRGLSPKLVVVAWGFGGLFGASLLLLLGRLPLGNLPMNFIRLGEASLISIPFSMTVLVYGLIRSFAEIAHKPDSRKWPTDDLE